VTITTTLTSTLSSLNFGVVVLEPTSLVINMFCTSIFLRHSLNRCSALGLIIQGYYIGILVGLTCCVLVHALGSINLIVAIGISSISLFQFWHVSILCHVLPQLDYAIMDLVVTTSTTSWVIILPPNVGNIILYTQTNRFTFLTYYNDFFVFNQVIWFHICCG
jgi:hypothetical protein